MYVRDLFAVLNQDIIKLPHQMTADGFSRMNMLEFQEHVECSSRRAQCLEGPINNGDGFILDHLSRHVIVIRCIDFTKFWLYKCC